MGILKGQNLRIYTYDTTAAKYKVIGMSTNCTTTLTNNTEEASHKDIVSLASMPTTTSKSWTVSVDSLNAVDAGAMLTAIKSMQPMLIMWDETSTVDNQTREKATFARKGYAFLNDLTLTFDNRTNSAKSLQFSGTGALETVGSSEAADVIPIGSYTKGQFVRLFLSSDNTAAPSKPISSALQLNMHVSLTLEDATTKDTTGDWVVQEATGLSYDITSNALVRSGETITSQVTGADMAAIEAIYTDGTPVKWKIANVSGDNNRTASSTIVSGSALVTQLQANGPNRSNAAYTTTLNGYGDYTVAA